MISRIFLVLIALLFLSACSQEEVNTVTAGVIKTINNSNTYISNLAHNESTQDQLKSNLATNIAEPVIVNNLQKISLENIHTYEDYKGMIDRLNFIIGIYNDKADTDTKFLSKEIESYNKFSKEINRYTPLINNYNEFINACHLLDSDNPNSVDQVLKKAISFTVEGVLISGGAFHKAVFSMVGKFSRTFGLTSFARVCPTCVSTVMSNGYWITKNYLINKVGELSENIVQ